MGLEKKHIFKSYLFFYKLLYKGTRTFDETAQRLCTEFVEHLHRKYHTDSIGYDWLWFYFNFQFSYWKELKLQDVFDSEGKKIHKKYITLSYIVGSKAIERFNARDQEFDWKVLQEIDSTFNRKDFEIVVNLPLKSKSESSYDPDEIYREQLLNTDKGLSNCITYTSLHSFHSKSCKSCQYQVECIQTQRQIYPNIYRNRKIDNGSTKQETTTR